MNLRNPFLIACGNFFFRYRKFIFPVFFILLLGFMRPRVIINPAVDLLLIIMGFVLTCLGEGLRILNIGLDYIERGGKGGQPYASKLVTGGLYNHVRNPMYVGNLLMAFGIGFYSGTPLVLVTALPFFIFFYYCMIAAEENFLRNKFGDEFEDFVRRVPRLIPSFKNVSHSFRGFTFNWPRVLAKENGTAFYVLMALLLLPWWRTYFLEGPYAASRFNVYGITVITIFLPLYIVIRVMTKRGRGNPLPSST